MEIRYDLESIPGVAVGIARGELTLEQIEQGAASMWQRTTGPDRRILWDLQEARFALGGDEVRELAEFVKEHSPRDGLRTAFVAAKDLEFGLVRMFEAFRETDGAETAVFRSREEALAWLRRGDDD